MIAMDFINDIYNYLAGGGVIMIPLGIVSLWMWLLIIERLIFFRSLQCDDVSFQEIQGIWSGENAPSMKKGLCADILNNFSRIRTGDSSLDKCCLNFLIMRNRPSIRRNLAVIAVLAGIAPLLGLLGTVTGMMTTFEVLGNFGTSNIRAMAGGLSEALLTTQTGLVVAIPGMFMAGFLNRRAKRFDYRLRGLTTSLQHYIGRKNTGGI